MTDDQAWERHRAKERQREFLAENGLEFAIYHPTNPALLARLRKIAERNDAPTAQQIMREEWDKKAAKMREEWDKKAAKRKTELRRPWLTGWRA